LGKYTFSGDKYLSLQRAFVTASCQQAHALAEAVLSQVCFA